MPDSEKTAVLLEQYRIAVDLYVHEDNLNWSKLNHLFYVNAGLGSVFGFIWQCTPQKLFFSIATICTIGLLSSLLFMVSIFCGVTYLSERKKAITLIESELQQNGAVRIVSTAFDKSRQHALNRSYSTYAIRTAPILFACIWLGIFLYSLRTFG